MDVFPYNMMLSMTPHISLWIEIFKSIHINNGMLLYCKFDPQVALIQKAFNNVDIKFLSVNLNEFNVNDFRMQIRTGIIIDTSCKGWDDVFRRNSSFEFTNLLWLINTDDYFSTTLKLSRYHIPVDSNVIIIHWSATNGLTLFEVYNTGFKSSGTYVVNTVDFRNSSLCMGNRKRKNLYGALLGCVSVITEELVNETYHHFLKESRNDKPDTLHKLKFFTVIRYLQDMYNFRYALLDRQGFFSIMCYCLSVRRTNSWGYSHNGNFDGLIGSLQRQEVEFGCSPVLFKINRAEVVNYIIPTWQTKHSFLFRQPKYQASYYSVYTQPLHSTVWWCMLVVLLLVGFVLNGMLKFKAVEKYTLDSSLSLICLIVCGAICQQGTTIHRGTVSARIVIFVMFMFSMTIYQFYNANILSGLLNVPNNNIRNLKELLESNLKAGVEDMPFNKDYFKRTTDYIPLKLYNTKIAVGNTYNFFNADHGMALVKQGGFAFHVDSSAAYRVMRKTFNEQEICEISEVPLFPPQYVGAVARKGSHYREYIAVGVSKMLEAGLMNRIKSVWDNPKLPCAKMRYNTIKAVNIREISTALLFLASGFLAAILVLLCEIYVYKFKIRYSQKQSKNRKTIFKRHSILKLVQRIRVKKNNQKRIRFSN